MIKPLRTSRILRQTNRQTLLTLLYFNEPISRLDLSQRSGLSPATVTNVVSELLHDGIIVETGVEESQGGRPRMALAMNFNRGYFIGMDLGETHIDVELFDIKLQSIAHVRHEVSESENQPAYMVSYIVETVERLLCQADVSQEQIIGLGIGIPGIVDRASGVSIVAPNWGWQSVPLLALLESKLHMPILLENGAKAMGLAEMWFGAGKGLSNLAVLLVGTGLGAGIILQRELYHGATNSAGEWGHTCVELRGRSCQCGSRGCIEAYAGARGIITTLHELDPHNPALQHATQQAILQALCDAAAQEDPLAKQVLSVTTEYLAAAIANVINLFNPELIVLGGWGGRLIGKLILCELSQTISRYALKAPLEAAAMTLSELNSNGVSMGAASLVLQDFLSGNLPQFAFPMKVHK
ncbi:MAG TPA: ROK family transcriptional regulator [Aggregatilineaceae bacterium]|nr:ROK family transcriptional regulator [Aggregatilineaceae bacterium]